MASVRQGDALRKRVDELIDFYERHKPQAGQRIEVFCSSAELHRIFGAAAESRSERELRYRGRVLVAIDKTASQRRKNTTAAIA